MTKLQTDWQQRQINSLEDVNDLLEKCNEANFEKGIEPYYDTANINAMARHMIDFYRINVQALQITERAVAHTAIIEFN